MLLHALYERSCTAPVSRLPCYGALYRNYRDIIIKKRSERRKHCALAVVGGAKKISPRRRPLPWGAGPPKFNQLGV